MSKQLDYYFIFGNNIDEIISGYRTLTGKAQIMPEWLFGYWQSRERYKTQNEILDALEGFRKRKLPIDNIVMDWNYWVIDTWGSYDFDPERFSDPKGMIDEIHKKNAKIMISCWPKFYPKVEHFKELNEKGFIYQQSLKEDVRDWLHEPINDYKGFRYGFYDAYAPEARKIFWRQLYNKLGIIGIDSWWMDASEPNIRDCTPMDYRKLLCGPTYYGSSDEFFNAYSIVNAESIYDGQRGYETAIENQKIDKNDAKTLENSSKWDQRGFGNKFSPNNRRVFLLTRNGFSSQQRYSTATWSGDIGTRWEDLKTQIPAGLNFSISGIPYWSQDIGGFSVEKRYEKSQKEFDNNGVENEDLKEWRELNTRWHQFGMFAPIYRSHGQFPFREPWNIAPENTDTYKIIKNCLEMRYRLMPYIYSLAAEVYFNDYTIMRPFVMDFGNDINVINIGHQFMFGPSIMVNPVYVYKARNLDVYFPKNYIWYDFYTGKIESNGGEKKNVEAPYEHIPLFIKSGSIIPFGPAIEYTRQKKADNLRIFVYLGNDGKFTLYEDEGINYGYEEGKYSKIKFNYSESSKILTIDNREGEYPGMLKERIFTIVAVSESNPIGYNPDLDGKEVKYNGEKVEIKL
jgi:alpha-D-xyloside xylohydrolase